MKSRHLLFCILFLFCAHRVGAQKMPSDYFDEGLKFANEEKYEQSIAAFRYIVDHYPHYEHYEEAFYNLGYVCYKSGKNDSAILIFRQILQSDFNEKKEIGGDIMSDPYANFRHRASLQISSIYFEQEQFDSCLHYFALSDTVYPYLHFCGNELAENRIYTAMRYAEIYRKLNRPQDAIKVLLPLVFENSLADNSDLIDTLKTLLISEKIPEPKKQLDEALDKMYLKTIHPESEKKYERYFFSYLGAEIPVPGSHSNNKGQLGKETELEKIYKSKFYEMISNL